MTKTPENAIPKRREALHSAAASCCLDASDDGRHPCRINCHSMGKQAGMYGNEQRVSHAAAAGSRVDAVHDRGRPSLFGRPVGGRQRRPLIQRQAHTQGAGVVAGRRRRQRGRLCRRCTQTDCKAHGINWVGVFKSGSSPRTCLGNRRRSREATAAARPRSSALQQHAILRLASSASALSSTCDLVPDACSRRAGAAAGRRRRQRGRLFRRCTGNVLHVESDATSEQCLRGGRHTLSLAAAVRAEDFVHSQVCPGTRSATMLVVAAPVAHDSWRLSACHMHVPHAPAQMALRVLGSAAVSAEKLATGKYRLLEVAACAHFTRTPCDESMSTTVCRQSLHRTHAMCAATHVSRITGNFSLSRQLAPGGGQVNRADGDPAKNMETVLQTWRPK